MGEPPPKSFRADTVIQRLIVIAGTAIFLVVPFWYGYSIDLPWNLRIGGINAGGFFYLLAILPGAAGVVHQALSSTRREESRRVLLQYYEFRDHRPESRPQHRLSLNAPPGAAVTPSNPVQSGAPGPNFLAARASYEVPPLLGAVVASVFLTGVFLLVAAMADRYSTLSYNRKLLPVDGIIFCGLGAYVAVMYYMAARMYANALSSRFITVSAVRSASALALGWAFVAIGVTQLMQSKGTNLGILFLAGLFHNWAINYLRSKAMNWFGAPHNAYQELPIGILEGVDDTTADLLSEYGIATVQHVATTDAGDLAERTLLPLDRVVDWIDQAVLIAEVKEAITPLRTLGQRCATTLARLYVAASAGDAAAKKLLESAAERSALGVDGLTALAARLASDYTVRFLYELKEGVPLK